MIESEDIIEYCTVTVRSDDYSFHTKVNVKLKEGWRLQGGVAISNAYFCQALTRKVDDND